MTSLKNKTIFITGASSGIGRSCAVAFAKEGANLLLAARRIERLEKLKDEFHKEYNVKVHIIKLDVRNRNEVEKTIKLLSNEWKKIDVLVNNAGLARGFSKTYEGDVDAWEEMIDTNVKGLLFVTRQVLPFMVERKSGHVINIGSTAGHEVYPNGNVYCATKYAVKALTQSIRVDVLDKKIKVSSVDPGLVETEFSIVRFKGNKEKAENVYKGLTPLTPDDIAEAIVFCATRPKHVNINEVILTPLNQASSTQVIKDE